MTKKERFELNKIINRLKLEVRQLLTTELNIEENNFSPIEKYSPDVIRTINFDNAANSTIYKLKTNFVQDKLDLMEGIISDTDVNGFYVFNNFYMRDTLLTKNSFPIVETLDINLKIKTTEEENEEVVFKKLKNCLDILIKAAVNVHKEYPRVETKLLENINYENTHIMKFNDFFAEQKYITRDSKIEAIAGFYSLILFENFEKVNSKHFSDWFEFGSDRNYKILCKLGENIYDIGYINIFKGVHLINIVLSWNTILSVLFGKVSLSNLLNIPESLISQKEN